METRTDTKDSTSKQTEGEILSAGTKQTIQKSRYDQDKAGLLGIKNSNLTIVVIALVIAVLPLLGLPPTNQRLITEVLVFVTFALSYDLLFGFTGIFSFGHALFFGVGAYSAALFALKLGWPIWLGVVVGVVICALLGLIIGFVSLRIQGVFFAMVTLALATTAYNLSSKLVDITRGDEGLSLLKAQDAPSETSTYYMGLGLALFAFFALYRLTKSPLGRVLVSIRENERRAAMIGYNVFLYKLIAIIFSAVLAGLAGSIFAFRNGIVNPGVLSSDISLLPLLMVILGGAGTLYGAIIGAVIIECLNFILSSREFTDNVKDWFIVGPIFQHWLLLLGLLYVLIVLFLPEGVMGTWQNKSNNQMLARVFKGFFKKR